MQWYEKIFPVKKWKKQIIRQYVLHEPIFWNKNKSMYKYIQKKETKDLDPRGAWVA